MLSHQHYPTRHGVKVTTRHEPSDNVSHDRKISYPARRALEKDLRVGAMLRRAFHKSVWTWPLVVAADAG